MLFLIDVRIDDMETAKPLIKEHLAYLDKYLTEGSFKMFGPYRGVLGGFVIADVSSTEEVKRIIALDPLQKKRCATWVLTGIEAIRTKD